MKNIELTTAKEKNEELFGAETKYILILLFLPIIIGELFFMIYISKGDMVLFNYIFENKNSIFVAWLIGYEILASFIVVKIFFDFIRYNKN